MLVELLADPVLAPLAGYDGSHRAQAALKATTSVLTGRFVAAAVAATTGSGSVPARTAGTPPTWWCPAGPGAVRAAQGHRAAVRDASPGAGAATSGSGRSSPSWSPRWSERAPEALDPVFAPLWRAAPDDAGPAAGGDRPGRLAHRPGGGGLARPPGRQAGHPPTRSTGHLG